MVYPKADKDKLIDELGEGSFEVNQYVKYLLNAVDEYGKQWYGKYNMTVPEIQKFVTPYGGRLVWELPGGTSITCHLKDKKKIRHKKRWSQIMYMYYFLGYELERKHRHGKMTEEQRDNYASNTFILALDGDVDFLPDSIVKVVDLAKRNPSVGAVCGRIHPTGSGYMKWYQTFEYAVGHWLQKATEHVLGCVLCSPGCFSLFRAAAVMDTNVMHTYKSLPEEPKHHVQYDQGEDRWLCTLMLKQGWRVEYSAASDSFTACPEGFKEFYNQRRRWMPSTLLNIMDLIGDYKQVVENNNDISMMYIGYQFVMMIGTFLGPGTIVLVLMGGVSLAFGLSTEESLIFNTVIIGIFIAACCFTKQDTQIQLAQLLTVVYAMVMIGVYVGVVIMMIDTGPDSLSALFFWITHGSFFVAAILHYQEWKCIFCLPIYMFTIPSMYLLLVIYAFFNMNDQGWGTREAPKEAEDPKAPTATGGTSKVEMTPRGLLKFLQRWLGSKLDEQSTKVKARESQNTDKVEKKETPKTADNKKKLEPQVEPAEKKFMLNDGKEKYLEENEVVFWKKITGRTEYLKPLNYDEKEKEAIRYGLLGII